MTFKKTYWFYSIVVVAVLAGLCSRAFAQELRVPLDENGTVEKIDQEMEARLALFPTYENFQEALLYQLPDSSYTLEIFYNRDGRLLKERTPMSAVAAQAFRHRVSDSMAARLTVATLDQDGRTALVGITTLYGLAFYGWAVPYIVDPSDAKTAVGLYMFTSSVSFFAPYLLTAHARVTDADAALALGAGQLGIAHGVFLDLLFEGEGASASASIGDAMGMSIAELIAGYYLADGTRMSAGKADVIYVGGLFGTGLGFSVGALADMYDAGRESSAGAVGLLGAGLGYVGGNVLANMQPYTPGDAQVLFGAGLLGSYVPLAIVNLVDNRAEWTAKPYLASSIIGTFAGLAAGHFLVKDKDFSTSSGSYIVLGEVAGALLGTGVAYLASSDNNTNGTIFLTASALGGISGFGIMYGLLGHGARRTETGAVWRVNVSPEGLAAYALSGKLNLPAGRSAPILQVQATF